MEKENHKDLIISKEDLEKINELKKHFTIKDEKIKEKWKNRRPIDFTRENKELVSSLINEIPKISLGYNVYTLVGLRDGELPFIKEYWQAAVLASLLNSKVTLLPRNAWRLYREYFDIEVLNGGMTDGIAMLDSGGYFSEFKRISVGYSGREAAEAFKSDLPFICLKDFSKSNKKGDSYVFLCNMEKRHNLESKPCLFIDLESMLFCGKKIEAIKDLKSDLPRKRGVPKREMEEPFRLPSGSRANPFATPLYLNDSSTEDEIVKHKILNPLETYHPQIPNRLIYQLRDADDTTLIKDLIIQRQKEINNKE